MSFHHHQLSDRAIRVIHGCMLVWAVVIGAVLVASAYGGAVDPRSWALPAMMAMAFPVVAIVALLTLIAAIVARARWAWIVTAACLMGILPAALNYSPVNITRGLSEEERARSFTVMTLNAMWWWHINLPEDGLHAATNPSVDYIIEQNPDIICTQENRGISNALSYGATQAQIDTIFARYPYHEVAYDYDGITIYSKYPITRIMQQDVMSESSIYACYRVSIKGHLLTVINTHLQSLKLSDEDKAAYVNMTRGDASKSLMKEMKSSVLHKVAAAMRERACQAEQIRNVLDQINGPVILCGDFNDIPGCYALRTVKGRDMGDAYKNAGLGPSTTFRSNRLYFRIDHILYRGDIHPVKAWRGMSVSDHYPILATFVWND